MNEKSVLISIQPYWVFLIIAKSMGWDTFREKTLEVRKSFPKDKSWNSVTKIYCSKDKKSFAKIPKEYQPFMKPLLGKVIGEFVCDEIYPIKVFSNCAIQNWICFGLARSELSLIDVANYIGANRTGYGWHISDLKIYDEPKELREFYKLGALPLDLLSENETLCRYCSDTGYGERANYGSPNGPIMCEGRFCDKAYQEYLDEEFSLARPPQSWCYVE